MSTAFKLMASASLNNPICSSPEQNARGVELSSKLSVGIHILTVLALKRGNALTSEFIAESVNTNPVVIRRLLGLFRAAGFVESKTGVGGGWLLVANPAEINLLEVLRVVEPRHQMFALHHSEPNQKCFVGCNIQKVLMEIYDEAWEAMAKQLERSSIASVTATLLDQM
ncbi:Rrf2 family transcriptional regulator [Singulisphaera sp. Ch08]|uniref:Rrf2 family transcriptional regulator n=1 Tax=Singulisphaera sp. Ch08 TaxID=3120278 RepID=A0AAU7CQF0_9BACT